MFASLKNSLRRKSSNRSNSSRHSWNSNDERDAPAELAATEMLAPPERIPMLNPSPPTRRPDRPGMNAFTVPSNEPPPAYTPSPTAASGPTLGPSPAYTPPASRAPSSSSAAAVTMSTTTTIPSTGEDKYAFLKQFDTVLLIDDSGSMAGRSWHETSQALSQLLPTIVERDSDGIDIFFLNHVSADAGNAKRGVAPGGYRNVTTVAEVERIFRTVRPGGGTPTGTRCRAILRPYLGFLEEMERKGKIDDVKPLNILAITDGVPSDDVESVLIAAARKLDALEAAPHQVGVQFFQVGNEEGAAEALRELDDGLVDLVQGGVRDMVDTVTWTGGSAAGEGGVGLTADGILKAVSNISELSLPYAECFESYGFETSP